MFYLARFFNHINIAIRRIFCHDFLTGSIRVGKFDKNEKSGMIGARNGQRSEKNGRRSGPFISAIPAFFIRRRQLGGKRKQHAGGLWPEDRDTPHP